MEKRIKLLRLEDLDSENSDFSDTEVRPRKKAVYQEIPIKPEKFRSKDFDRWDSWVKHFRSIVNVNGWTDSQAIVTLTTFYRSWAFEELERVLSRYVEKGSWIQSPTLGGACLSS